LGISGWDAASLLNYFYTNAWAEPVEGFQPNFLHTSALTEYLEITINISAPDRAV